MFLQKKSLAVAMIIVITLMSTLAIVVTVKAQTNTNLTVYAGEVSSSTYGFSLTSASSITSPGPTLNLLEGTTYTVTVNNVSHLSMDHSWEIVSSKAVGTPLWGAGVAVTSYLAPGASGSITFTPTQTGNFYYVCTFPGHIALGMWGKVVVSSTVPEFPITLTLMFAALALTAMAAFLARQKINPHTRLNIK